MQFLRMLIGSKPPTSWRSTSSDEVALSKVTCILQLERTTCQVHLRVRTCVLISHMSGTKQTWSGRILFNREQQSRGCETHQLFPLSQSFRSQSVYLSMSTKPAICYVHSSRSRTRSPVRLSANTLARLWFWMRGCPASVRRFSSCTSTATALQ